jgi:hypothetical protein
MHGRLSPVIFGVTTLCIVLFLLIFLLPCPTSEGRDIHVDKDDADPTVQLGTAEFPYDSIQEAVDTAVADDIIYVHASTEVYEEIIWLSTSDSLSIIGDGIDDVTLQVPLEESRGIYIATSGNVIEGMTIFTDMGTAFGMDNQGQDNEFRQSRIVGFDLGIREVGIGNTYHDISFEDCNVSFNIGQAQLSNLYMNTFTNCNYTIRMYGDSAEEYDHTIAENNTMDGKPTLFYRGLSDDTFIFNEMNHSFLGFYDCDNLTIKDTTVTGLYDGLLIANCRDVEIFDSTFEDNVDGISIVVSENVHIHDVGVVENSYYQIMCSRSHDILIENLGMNDVSNGINLWLCSDSILDGLDISASGVGIRLALTNELIIGNSTIIGNGNIGVGLNNCTGIAFLSCEISEFSRGFDILFSDTNINITDTSIMDCETGIFAEGAEFNLKSSDFNSNTQDLRLGEGGAGGTWYNSSALDTVIDRDKIGMDDNCSLWELQYLTVTVRDQNSDPIGGAEAIVRWGIEGGGEEYTSYATTLYGGDDHLTPLSGEIGPIPVGANRYTTGSVESFLTVVNASYDGVEDMLELSVTGPTEEELSLSVVANQPPEVSITAPGDGATVSGSITISGTGTDPNGDESIESVEIRLDGGTWDEAVGTADWAFGLDTTYLSEGSHTIGVRAYDGEFHSPVATIDITVANNVNLHAPVVEITSPDDGDEVSGVVTITGTTSDEDGDETILSVEVSIDGGLWAEAEGITDWEIMFDSSEYSDGSIVVDVRASDGVHTSEDRSITLVVNNHGGSGGENTPPEILTFTASSTTVRAGKTVTVDGTIRDLDGEDDIPSTGVTICLCDKTNQSLVTFSWPIIVITEAAEANTLVIRLDLETSSDWDGKFYLWLSVEDSEGAETVQSMQFTVEKNGDDSDDQVFDWVEDDVLFFGIVPALIIIPLVLVIVLVTIRRREATEGEGGGEEGEVCPTCGVSGEYVEEYDSSYCWNCEEYF